MDCEKAENPFIDWLNRDIEDPNYKIVFDNLSHIGASGTLLILGLSVFATFTFWGVLTGYCITALALFLGFVAICRSYLITLNIIISVDQKFKEVMKLRRRTGYLIVKYPKQTIGALIPVVIIGLSMVGLYFKIASIAKWK
jgi:hypothetical protein